MGTNEVYLTICVKSLQARLLRKHVQSDKPVLVHTAPMRAL